MQSIDPLRRLYKFVLKKLIGQFLVNRDLSSDQFDVSLASGFVELRDLMINKDVCDLFAGLFFFV